MVTGRKPRSPEVAEASGAYKKDPQRRKDDAPAANLEAPEMPADLNAEEREKWEEIVRDLDSMGVLSSELGSMIERYARAWGGWNETRRQIEATGGMAIVDGNGNLRRNPLNTDLHKFNDIMIRLLPEFGLTPSSRGRLKSMKPPEQSGMSSLMDRMRGSPN